MIAVSCGIKILPVGSLD